jgi:hypothetical protein
MDRDDGARHVRADERCERLDDDDALGCTASSAAVGDVGRDDDGDDAAVRRTVDPAVRRSRQTIRTTNGAAEHLCTRSRLSRRVDDVQPCGRPLSTASSNVLTSLSVSRSAVWADTVAARVAAVPKITRAGRPNILMTFLLLERLFRDSGQTTNLDYGQFSGTNARPLSRRSFHRPQLQCRSTTAISRPGCASILEAGPAAVNRTKGGAESSVPGEYSEGVRRRASRRP